MLSFAPHLRIYLHTQPTDMRKSFDGLSGLVRSVFQADPTDGSLFLFINRRRDRIKIMWWDRDGLALFYKRLEAGTFELLQATDASDVLEIDATQLAMLLGGVTFESARRRKRYARAG
ncbi:MAG: IS66 family insertion sequence element accessory protein TnpB [Pirellulaceae bacterium]|nr:IS66 family insertion sequence element accessory protein TnpB [Pirellulaceae bacterium]